MEPADEISSALALPPGFAGLMADARAAYDLPPLRPEAAEHLNHAFLVLLFPHYTHESGCRAREVVATLPSIREALLLDARATAEGDPAACGVDEVVLAYPGFFATAVYRLAHHLWAAKVPLLPRVLAELAHWATGIDIHPGATIGAAFAIDHGSESARPATPATGSDPDLPPSAGPNGRSPCVRSILTSPATQACQLARA